MAYDPKDPADKKIVQDLIDAALEEAATTHEADVTGLKNKNKELVAKLRAANDGKGKPEDIAALEEQLDGVKADLAKVNKEFKKTTDKLTETSEALTKANQFSDDLLVEGQLTEHLATNKIATEFMPAVKALLKPQAIVKVDDKGQRQVLVGEKSLGDYAKEWAQGDQGKAFVAATINNGGGAGGGSRTATGNGKTLTRTQHDALALENPALAAKHFAEGGTLVDG